MDQPKEKWIESSYSIDGPLYFATMSMLVIHPNRWRNDIRIKILRRLLLAGHIRGIHQRPVKTFGSDPNEKSVKGYEHYKKFILFFALIDQFYSGLLKHVKCVKEDGGEWVAALADWIRRNDDEILKSTAKILSTFQDDLLPSASVDEVIDVCGLLDDVPSPASFLLEVLSMVG